MRFQSPLEQRRRRVTVAACLAALVAVAATAWFVWFDQPSPAPKIVANNFSGRATACFAADPATASTDAATAIWKMMQQTGTAGAENVQQLVVPAGDSTQAQALLAGLVNQHCDLVVTDGHPFGQAIGPVAKINSAVRFTAIDSGLTESGSHTTLVSSANALSAVQQQMRELRR